jgi:hypothetical protein
VYPISQRLLTCEVALHRPESAGERTQTITAAADRYSISRLANLVLAVDIGVGHTVSAMGSITLHLDAPETVVLETTPPASWLEVPNNVPVSMCVCTSRIPVQLDALAVNEPRNAACRRGDREGRKESERDE